MPLLFTADCRELLANVSALQSVTGKKGTIAILANILFEAMGDHLSLTATDLEVGIKTTVKAEIRSEGSITLPARKLFEILRETKDSSISIEVTENNWAEITTQSGHYRLAGSDSEEFPSFPKFDEEAMAALPAEALKDCIEKTAYSIAQDGESQFNLTAALVEKEVRDGKNHIRFVSSDGHRLSMMEREIDTDISAMVFHKTTLIPRKGVMEMAKFCERSDFVELGFDEKQAVLRSDDALMIIRLMNGDFPDYRNIFSAIERSSYIEIEREPFMAAMKRINLFTEDLFSAVRFHFSGDTLTLASQNMDIGSGEEVLPVVHGGEDMTLGFNGKYFIETLQVMNSEKIKAFINSDESPCLITGDEDEGFVSVIMPMKI